MHFPQGEPLSSNRCTLPQGAPPLTGQRRIIISGSRPYATIPRSTGELISCVEKFLSLSPAERAAMGRAGRAKMEREFDREIVIDKYIREVEQ